MKRHLLGVAVAVLGTAVLSGIGLQSAAAADPPVDPAAVPAAAIPTTVTLPLFGAPLTIGITTGPGGALTDVSVDPADNTTATQLRPHKVVFQSADPANPTGDPARVVVRSRKGGQSVSARAGTLGQVSGPGMWSGDLFGDGTTTSTVAFTVVDGAAAGPDITGITTTGATAVVGTVDKSTDTNADGSTEMQAKVSVKFTNTAGDQSRTVSIKVSVETAADGTTEAKLSISLGALKGVAVDAATAAGPHTWTGMLCDSSTATIAYVVAADGSISGVVATPATADVAVHGHKIDARFSHDERVRISVREDNGLIKIDVDERIKCDSPNPTTNAATTTTVADDANDNDNEANHHGGHGHDDTTTTDVTTTTAGA
jgi:hypothetical protein